jgi:hypothetical protein
LFDSNCGWCAGPNPRQFDAGIQEFLRWFSSWHHDAEVQRCQTPKQVLINELNEINQRNLQGSVDFLSGAMQPPLNVSEELLSSEAVEGLKRSAYAKLSHNASPGSMQSIAYVECYSPHLAAPSGTNPNSTR